MRTSLLLVFASFLAACGGSAEASPSGSTPPPSTGGEARSAADGLPADAPETDAEPATADARPVTADARSAAELETGWPDPDTCLPQLLTEARERGGLCLQPELIGDARVEACTARLQADGWVRDEAVEQRVLNGTGTRIVCVRAP